MKFIRLTKIESTGEVSVIYNRDFIKYMAPAPQPSKGATLIKFATEDHTHLVKEDIATIRSQIEPQGG